MLERSCYNIATMNKLSTQRRSQIISALIEGNSIRATCRMTGAAKGTVIKLLREVGEACALYQDEHLRNLPCNYIQCDEIWSFCYAKQKNVPENKEGVFGYGDVWTWTALDADTKLVPSWLVGLRNLECATAFIDDLANRLANRVQLTTDGNNVYLQAVENAFGIDVDYAMLIKIYGEDKEPQKRYSPARCMGTEKLRIKGTPDKRHVSTSYVERQNLTMRMSMRRFTRLTNAFSKKVENLEYDVALHFMYYNFARPHKSLSSPYPTTPAMAADVSDHVWSIEEIVGLIDGEGA